MEIKRNLIANFAGRAWTAAISFIFLPIYVRLLGMEAYGLITIFVTLNALIQILDFGLSTVINRELARLMTIHELGEQSSEQATQQSRDLVFTLEGAYFLIGIVIAGIVMAVSPWSYHWVHARSLSSGVVNQTFMIMGLLFAFLWPDSLYAGALMGLHQQVKLNWIKAIIATVQYGGAVLLLNYFSRTIQMFFLWQIVIVCVQTLWLRALVWRSLPPHPKPARFRKSVWVGNWRFAIGMTGISLTGLLLGQLDKLVLSRTLPLEETGYYGIATQLASILLAITGPLVIAVFPSCTRLAIQNNVVELRRLYHRSVMLLASIVIPVGLTIVLFSQQIVTFYLHDKSGVSHIASLLPLLTIGTMGNAIMSLPLCLQTAYGWTQLSLYKNVIALLVFIPLLPWMVSHYGATGAAVMWIGLNTYYLVLEVPIMHRRLLPGEAMRFYIQDLGIPFLISISLLLLAWRTLPDRYPIFVQILWISTACALSMIACFTILRTKIILKEAASL